MNQLNQPLFTHRKPNWISITGLLLMLVLAACNESAATQPVSLPTAMAPANLPVVSWDYVVMGVFTRNATSDIPARYRSYIEKDQSVEVILHEQERWEPKDMVDNLQNNEELRLAIEEAEVITFDYSIDWINLPEGKYRSGICHGEDNQDCLREAVQKAKGDWNGIVDLITDLRAGTPVLIRVFLMGDWFYDWAYIGDLTPEKKEVLLKYYHELQEFLEDDAEKRGIPVIRVFPEPYFNETNPPTEYQQSDGIHYSEEGSQIIADNLRELGYEFVILK
jgi:hypothetical protein